uniref:Reverse transcriptase domain, reverse transcriptase zinc-binding domain protein n=1 Tax=Tanacetum cinerariifolium TaxID=118510 RepID=A0A699KKW7_TANCI|nr:reverse transcriptase domain, reverse transcriptase zinc-binding domain protein [Tanacetum cinerariifolium]
MSSYNMSFSKNTISAFTLNDSEDSWAWTVVNKDCFVRDNWINGWSFDWVRNIISGPNASQLALLQNNISAFTLNDSEDSWAWTVGGHSFSVSSARHLIDSRLLPEQGPATRWCNIIPKKINIFVWRALRDRLPTRWNLSRKGIELNSLNYPICDTRIESTFHTI